MIVHLQRLLRWWARLYLPFARWRVPVQVVRGTARASGQQVRLLVAGRPRLSRFVFQEIFNGEPVVEKSAQVPVWALQRHLDLWQSDADLTHVGIDRLSAALFLGRGYLAVPSGVSAWMSVPKDLPSCLRQHSKVASDFRRTKRHGYSSQLSNAAGDFDLFYDHYYLPYARGRHQQHAHLSPRWMLRLVFRFGAVQWLTLNGERLSGDLLTTQGRDYIPVAVGVRDGRPDLLRQGVLAALYVHALEHARQRGCTRIIFGGSLPSLHDGVLRYKSKWQDGFTEHAGHLSANHVLLLRWNRLTGPVADFLSQTGLIHHDQSGYSALWVFPSHLPLTAENLRQQYGVLKLKGLHRFRILLPGAAPPGFDCPPEVRLIDLAAAEKAGAGGINGLG